MTEPTDAELIAELEAAGVVFMAFRGGLSGTKELWTTSGSQDAKKIAAGMRAAIAKWGSSPAVAGEPVAWQGVNDPTDLYHEKPPQADVHPLYRAASPQPAEPPRVPQPMPDLAQLTERDATAWPGVDPQALREGRVPLTDEQCDAIYEELDAFGRELDHYEYGLPYCLSDGETLAKPEARAVIRRAAHGIKHKEGENNV